MANVLIWLHLSKVFSNVSHAHTTLQRHAAVFTVIGLIFICADFVPWNTSKTHYSGSMQCPGPRWRRLRISSLVHEWGKIDGWIGAVCAVMPSLCRELSQKAELSIYLSVFVPALICCHELWVMIVRKSFQIQALEMRFLKVGGHFLRHRGKGSVTRWELRVDLRLLHF